MLYSLPRARGALCPPFIWLEGPLESEFPPNNKNRSCCDLPSALLDIEEGAMLLSIWAGLLRGGQIGTGESDWDDRKATGAGVLVRGDSAPGWRGVGGSRAGQEPDGQWL